MAREKNRPTLRNFETGGYRDIESESERLVCPHIQSDGTSVEWPVGWDALRRTNWRKKHGLEAP
jgi:hypothetical protein